jgi:ribosomal protein L29
MKINDKKELHLKTADELQKLIKDGNEIVAQLRLDNIQNKLKNTRSLFNTRQTIAVMKSILKTKEVKNA